MPAKSVQRIGRRNKTTSHRRGRAADLIGDQVQRVSTLYKLDDDPILTRGLFHIRQYAFLIRSCNPFLRGKPVHRSLVIDLEINLTYLHFGINHDMPFTFNVLESTSSRD